MKEYLLKSRKGKANKVLLNESIVNLDTNPYELAQVGRTADSRTMPVPNLDDSGKEDNQIANHIDAIRVFQNMS